MREKRSFFINNHTIFVALLYCCFCYCFLSLFYFILWLCFDQYHANYYIVHNSLTLTQAVLIGFGFISTHIVFTHFNIYVVLMMIILIMIIMACAQCAYNVRALFFAASTSIQTKFVSDVCVCVCIVS